MPNSIVKQAKLHYPQYRDLSDDELTLRYAREFPEYLETPDFKLDYDRITRKPELVAPTPKERAGAFESIGRRAAGGLQGGLGGPLWKGVELGARLLGADDLAQYSKEVSAEAREYDRQQRLKSANTGVAGFLGDVAGAAPSLLPILPAVAAAPLVGLARMTAAGITAGATGGLSTFSDAEKAYYDKYKSEGMSDSEAESAARKSAAIPSIASGVATGTLTRFMPVGGVESVSGLFGKGAAASAVGRAAGAEAGKRAVAAGLTEAGVAASIKAGVARQVGLAEARALVATSIPKAFIKGATNEAIEEGIDQIAQSAIQKLSYDPELTLKQAIDNVINAAMVGGALGGSIQAAVQPSARKGAEAAIRQDKIYNELRVQAEAEAKADATRREDRLEDEMRREKELKALDRTAAANLEATYAAQQKQRDAQVLADKTLIDSLNEKKRVEAEARLTASQQSAVTAIRDLAAKESGGLTDAGIDTAKKEMVGTVAITPAAAATGATGQQGGVVFDQEMFQGRGATPEAVYGPEAVAQGRAVPILGPGSYYAFTNSDAKAFGKVSKGRVQLRNPLVIDSSAKWIDLLNEADAQHLNTGDRLFYTEPHGIAPATARLKAYVQAKGHDGIVIKGTKIDQNKRLRESFGHDQVVSYAPTTPPAATGATAGDIKVGDTITAKSHQITGLTHTGKVVSISGDEIGMVNNENVPVLVLRKNVEAKPPTPAATGATAQKQPWEMTREEYLGDGERLYKGITKKTNEGETITEIDARKVGKRFAGYFTTKKEVADKFTKALTLPGASHTVEATVKFENPLIVDAKGKPGREFMLDALSEKDNNASLIAEASRGEHDGIIIKNTADEGDIHIAAKPEQIRSSLSHRSAVEAALREGKPVPESVLADYPDLKPAPAQPAQAQADIKAVTDRILVMIGRKVLPKNVKVVYEPESNFAAYYQSGEIVINAARIVNVEAVLVEEAVHAVWADPELQAAWDTVKKTVTIQDIDEQRLRAAADKRYPDNAELREEAAVAKLVRNRTPAIKGFLIAIRRAVAKAFGFHVKLSDIELIQNAAMSKLTADSKAVEVESSLAQWEKEGSPQKQAQPPAQAALVMQEGLQDFGVKLGGARKDLAASIARDLTDTDIARMSLSEIWPKSEVDAIEDKDMAAVAHVLRSIIPSKPRNSYKLARWVERVKLAKSLMGITQERGIGALMLKLPEYQLQTFADKITLLRGVDWVHWDRIGGVHNFPDAYSYGTDDMTHIPQPTAMVAVDGTRHIKSDTLENLIARVNETLSAEDKPDAKMQFEVRGRSGGMGGFFINKAGDPLRRKLKVFETADEALEFKRDPSNYEVLAQAWEDIKATDNVKETDVRRAENRPRTGADHRQGADATPEMFQSTFGFRGVEFGNWVSQGKNLAERQGMLNAAYDALMDLASVVGIPPKAISLNGTLGLGLGSRGYGRASAHYEPGTIVINLTKPRGAGSLGHEWFHALDNYFQRKRNESGVKDGRGDYITNLPETYYENGQGHRLSEARFKEWAGRAFNQDALADWKRVEGVRPVVAEAFAELVKVLNASPMAKRAALVDKGKSDGYWSRIIERAARSFENYLIAQMQLRGYQNDYLANVVLVEDFARDKGRYPYLLPEEVAPVAKAFDDLFSTMRVVPEGGVKDVDEDAETRQQLERMNLRPGALYAAAERGAGSELGALQGGVDGVDYLNWADRFRTNFITKYAPITKMERVLRESAGMGRAEFGMERWFERLAGVAGIAKASIIEMRMELDPLVAGDEKAFNNYIFWQYIERRSTLRAQALADVASARAMVADGTATDADKDSIASNKKLADQMEFAGYDNPTVAKKNLDSIRANLAKSGALEDMDKAVAIYVKHTNLALDNIVDSGYLAQDRIDKYRSQFPVYIPIINLQIPDSKNGYQVVGFAGKGNYDATKGRVGISDPNFKSKNALDAFDEYIFRMHAKSEMNRAKRRIYELVVTADRPDIARVEYDRLHSTESGFSLRVNGVDTMVAAHPEVVAAVNSFSDTASNTLNDFLRKANSVLKFGATSASLAFQVRNLFLGDLPTLALMSKAGITNPINAVTFVIDVITSFAHNFRASAYGEYSPLMLEFMKSGAMGSSMHSAIDSLGRDTQTGASSEGKISQYIIDAFGKMSNTIEQTSKLAGFKRLMDKAGVTTLAELNDPIKQMALVAEVRNYCGSPDFARNGSVMGLAMIRLGFVFVNPAMAGNASALERLTANLNKNSSGSEKKAALTAQVRLGFTVGLATMISYALRSQDDEAEESYDGLDKKSKEDNFHLITDKYDVDIEGNKVRRFVKIPKRGVIKIVANTMEAYLDYSRAKDPEDFTRMMGRVLEEVIPLDIKGDTLEERIQGAMASVNPAIRVPIEYATGMSFYSRQPTVPRSMRGAANSEQYRERTNENIKVLAGVFGVSPLKFKQALESATGGLTRTLLPEKESELNVDSPINIPIVKGYFSPTYRESADADTIDRLFMEAANVSVDRMRKATQFVDSREGMDVEAIYREAIDKLGVQNRDVVEKVRELLILKRSGVTKEERRITQLPPKQRAELIIRRHARTKPQDRDNLIQSLINKRVITRDTAMYMEAAGFKYKW